MFRMMMILFLISITTISARAGVQKVTVRVDGLACPFCAYGLEKKCKKLGELSGYDVDFEKGLVHVTFGRDAAVTPEDFKTAVREAGFTYRYMDVKAAGELKVIEEDKSRAVLLEDTGLSLPLQFESESVQAAVLKESAGKRVQVEGRIAEDGKKFVLNVKQYKITGLHENNEKVR